MLGWLRAGPILDSGVLIALRAGLGAKGEGTGWTPVWAAQGQGPIGTCAGEEGGGGEACVDGELEGQQPAEGVTGVVRISLHLHVGW